MYVRRLMVRRFWITFSLEIFAIILFSSRFYFVSIGTDVHRKELIEIYVHSKKNSFFTVDSPKVTKQIELKNEQRCVKMNKTTSKM